jgi:hypothetical protein
MSATITSFKNARAPCGRVVDGEQYQDLIEEGLVIEEVTYACGCRSIRHDYHDGSVSRKLIRHNGVVLADEIKFER